ncbi:MAG TPA: TerC family protein [Tepidisphaeraceae bacterium]|nr:TerC family protein [Tepidisphaeraceae bacterium]
MDAHVIWVWIGFIVFVLAMLALDLGVFHRKAHTVSVKEALIWSAVWISMALVFNVLVYFAYEGHWLGLGMDDGQVATDPVTGTALNGRNAAIKFFTGYVIEKSLSVDNIFVIALVFAFFKIPNMYQHRVLFWGILGALVMRGIFIGLGAALIARFHWILYVFGAFLLYTAYKMLTSDEDPDPGKNPAVRLVHRYFPVTQQLHGQRFLVRRSELAPTEPVQPAEGESAVPAAPAALAVPPGSSTWVLTPLALALVVVEFTDLIFAVDSIPAIFAITGDPFLVFTSNVFAILGLRALYFALAGILDKFYYLKVSLAVVLGLVGVKMLVADFLKPFPFWKENLSFVTLGLIALILGAGVVASLVRAERHPLTPHSPPPTPEDTPAPGPERGERGNVEHQLERRR